MSQVADGEAEDFEEAILGPDGSRVLVASRRALSQVSANSPEEAAFYETIFSLTNGHLGVRPSLATHDRWSLPGCFISSIYAPSPTSTAELVLLPSATAFRIRPASRIPSGWSPQSLERRTLYFDEARLETRTRWRTGPSQHVDVVHNLIAHATRPDHLVAWGQLTARGRSHEIDLEHAIDWSLGNPYLGGKYTHLQTHHLRVREADGSGGELRALGDIAPGDRSIEVRSGLIVPDSTSAPPVVDRHRVAAVTRVGLTCDEPVSFTQTVTFSSDFSTRRDTQPFEMDGLLAEHTAEWRERWSTADVRIDGSNIDAALMRFAVFQMQQLRELGSPGNIPARGLTSAYHSGHFFFNSELFKVPYYMYTAPATARKMLEFRHRTLPAARECASGRGFKGAFFAQEVDDVGRDASPIVVRDLWRQRLLVERASEKLFVGALVAFAAERFWRTTRDASFLVEVALDLAVEIACFYESTLEEATGGFLTVQTGMGPDEFHHEAPASAFVDTVAAAALRTPRNLWHDACAIDLENARAWLATSNFTVDDFERWFDLSQKMRPVNKRDGVVEQFDGYFALPDQRLRRDGAGARLLDDSDVERMDTLAPFSTQLIKEGDVVLLLSILPLLFDHRTTAATFAYYEPRTAHESSLSYAPHGIVAGRLGAVEEALRFLRASNGFDLQLQNRDDYRNGLHVAAYAGGWLVLALGMLRLDVDGDSIRLDPQIPGEWSSVALDIACDICVVTLLITATTVAATVVGPQGAAVVVEVAGDAHLISTGATCSWTLDTTEEGLRWSSSGASSVDTTTN